MSEEQRDERGRWTSGGASSATLKAAAAGNHARAASEAAYHAEYERAGAGRPGAQLGAGVTPGDIAKAHQEASEAHFHAANMHHEAADAHFAVARETKDAETGSREWNKGMQHRAEAAMHEGKVGEHLNKEREYDAMAHSAAVKTGTQRMREQRMRESRKG